MKEYRVSVEASGYIGHRMKKSFERLEQKEYTPDAVFKTNYDWPGDWEGRILLALVMLAQATGRKPKYLDEIYRRIPQHLNEKGYFGKCCPSGHLDEQQLSGHSWFLRALCEHYEWKQDDASLRYIQQIVNELLLPTKGSYATYPTEPREQFEAGKAIGEHLGLKLNNWNLSSDIGCAFIMLDGATHAYRILKLPELKSLIEEMIDTFLTIDLIAVSFQTHATLTAARGILRFYETTGEVRYLHAVKHIYHLYKTQGMTLHYANYNWFNEPKWTEPCAIVDSYLLAFDLWNITNERTYIEDAQLILYNGLGYAQRPNGGFGCDTCSGTKDEYLKPADDLFEAFWCCSMRGGDGLARSTQQMAVIQENVLTLPFYNDCVIRVQKGDQTLILHQQTNYPYEGKVRMDVIKNELEGELALNFIVPSWVNEQSVICTVDGKSVKHSEVENVFLKSLREGTSIELTFDMSLIVREPHLPTHLKGFHYVQCGPLLLGTKVVDQEEKHSLPERPVFEQIGDAAFTERTTRITLQPLHDLIDQSCSEAMADQRQLLFRKQTIG